MRRLPPSLALVGTLLLGVAAGAATAPRVEFLTIEANDNGASGGHAALRVGAQTFHFQAEQGRLRLTREPWPDFRFRYRVLENRALHARRLALSADEAAALRRHLDRRLWLEAEERRRLADLQRDVELLEALARQARGEPAAFALRGAGFFDSAGAESAGSAAIRALSRRIARERGGDFAEARGREARASLRALAPSEDGDGADPREAEAAGPPHARFSRRYDEALAALVALEVLRDAPALRDAARVALPGDVPALTPAERRALGAQQRALETQLVRLVASQRPDWGFAFVLGEARLAALAESLASGRLVVLDALPDDGPRLDAGAVARVAEPLRRRLARRRAELDSIRRRLGAAPAHETRLAQLEAVASRYADLAHALEGAELRLAAAPLVPRGVALRSALPVPEAVREDLEALLGAARARLREALAADARRYEYALFTNNCVTALFREMETALAPAPAAGGALAALRFAPFVAAHVALPGGRVVEERTLPSYRSERLAALRRHEPGWRVALRESNTLTSTLYEPNPADSRFLFFTDGSVWSRPLLGAANLAAGLVQGAAGLLRLPWDDGESLVRGARGVAASLPELVFVNLRKGTFPFAEPHDGEATARAPRENGTLGAAPEESP